MKSTQKFQIWDQIDTRILALIWGHLVWQHKMFEFNVYKVQSIWCSQFELNLDVTNLTSISKGQIWIDFLFFDATEGGAVRPTKFLMQQNQNQEREKW